MSPRASIGLLASFCAVLAMVRGDIRLPYAGYHQHVEINFWNGFTGPDGRTMLRMIRRFNEQNPDIRVTMQRMGWATYYNKLMVAAVDGRGPQVFVIHASTLPRMQRAGFVADVSGMFGPGGLPTEDFDPYVLEQIRYGDEMVGVPLDIHPQGLYINREMMAEYGIERPPATREEFVQLADKLRQDHDGDQRPDEWGFSLTMWRNNFQSLMPQFGGRFMDEQGNSDLDHPGNVRALEFLESLSEQELIPPPQVGLGWIGFRQERVAMVFDGIYMLADLQRLGQIDYEGAPMPVIGDRPGTMADSHVLCIRRNLPERERKAAEKFVAFLSANSLEWAGAGQVPARRSVRAMPEFKDLEVQYAFAQQIPYMMYPPRTPVLFELTLEIDLAVERVMRGRMPAQEALELADQNTQRFIDRDRRESAARGSANEP